MRQILILQVGGGETEVIVPFSLPGLEADILSRLWDKVGFVLVGGRRMVE
jgi:hypothetical protein